MKALKITVSASRDHLDVLDVRDAMQQVQDYFDLMTDSNLRDVVWKLVSASAASPLTVEGVPVDLRTNVSATGLIGPHVKKIKTGLTRLRAGKDPGSGFPKEKQDTTVRMLQRNLNGIGTTALTFDDADARVDFDRETARRALDVIKGREDALYSYLFQTFARREVGSVEGIIVDLGTDYEEPAIHLLEKKSGREIWCRMDKEGLPELGRTITAGDVWRHRNVRIRGELKYDANGNLTRVFNGTIRFVDPKDVSIADLHDPDFTGGLPACEYLDRLREDSLD